MERNKDKTQIGTSLTGDFGENAWTFEMPKNWLLTAGKFAILPKDKYDKLLTALKGISNSMSAHPDCTEDSEFEGMVNRCDEILNEVTG